MNFHFPWALALGAAGFLAVLTGYAFSTGFRGRFHFIFRPITPSNQAEIPYMDGLRGLLALQVALFHSWQWNGLAIVPAYLPFLGDGANAVVVFVAISGFFIYRSLARIQLRHPVDLGLYFIRRLLRTYPLYFTVTLLIFIFGWRLAQEHAATLTSDLLMFGILGGRPFSNPTAWSLYVEEAFYALIPVWIFFCRRRPVLFSTLSVAALLYFEGHAATREFMLFKFFFVGILASEVQDKKLVERLPDNFKNIFVLFSVAVGIYSFCDAGFFLATPRSVPAVAACFLILVSVGQVPQFVQFLSMYPLRVLGIVSYSVYIVHSLIITAQTNIFFDGLGALTPKADPVNASLWRYSLVAPAVIFYSLVSYSLVEFPFLRLRTRLRGWQKEKTARKRR